jgi:hypothetical protein
MNNHRMLSVFTLSTLAAATAAFVPATAQAYTYYCDAPHYYPANACRDTSNDVDELVRETLTELDSDGWSGSWYEGENAWPQDFIDNSLAGYSDGLDYLYADNVNLAFFAGHGNNARIFFGYPHDEGSGARCDAGGPQTPNGFSLGRSAGQQAAIAIFASCCTLNPNTIQYMYANNGANQVLGFGSDAVIESGMLHEFYEDTQDTPNVESWLDRMEDRPGWGTGDNSTVALQVGNDANNAAWLASFCKIRADRCNVNFGPGPYNYWGWWRNHGTGLCP